MLDARTEIVNATTISHGLGALFFLVLGLLLATSWKGRMQGGLLVAAVSASTLWALLVAWFAYSGSGRGLVSLAEAARYAAWYAFLVGILRTQPAGARLFGPRSPRLLLGYGLCLLLGLLPLLPESLFAPLAGKPFFAGYLALSLGGLWFVENLFRNTRPDQRWAIKFLCFGLGGMFSYDFFLYSHAVLFGYLDSELWAARGLVNALVVPLIAVSTARNPDWSLDVFVSRRMVFHTATLVAAGGYLLAMAAAGYYLRSFGGEWGSLLQIAFFFAALLLLVLLLFSGHMRARLKVFLNKHFFNYRYDYREEWLRFTRTLGGCRKERAPRECVIRATATIVDSAGGVLWMRERGGARYLPVAHWNMPQPAEAEEAADGALVSFLRERGWVVEIPEFSRNPELYEGLELPAWLEALDDAWLVVPLLDAEELIGFILLQQPLAPVQVDWEVLDLLKTAACQAAIYLGQYEALEALAEARQFEGFHRLSAYILHDLKNIIAQQSLITRNAARHRDNPAFIDDALGVMSHSVGKMERLLGLLRSGMANKRPVPVDLVLLVTEVCEELAAAQPVPCFRSDEAQALVMADRDRMRAAIRNMVQNAQQATAASGRVDVRLSRKESRIEIVVEDTGSGMDAEFVRERLFRPFDTTKGDTGMGIGAYETRELVRSMGGDVEVVSRPGEGTRFAVWLPAPDLDQEEWEERITQVEG
ncbi:PEP-CTERM system histidine kinase PrsK [Thiohalobacter sp. IOR34]|uniref:XrtA/PEP-CTERM system histidine kinase PrsK n=1 Tax=Thiohalobacter sp. IOR34 TaxID=3057176 RepID=UPI0025B0F00F|nr:XrtA/PEP-CTERM system histidine kinase PrsK [Thiohalobacter sp. IOR34]WJW74477.1 PEP-CTERM system histidine kinase PrsK [Thiohalobacter sp. IOR34]